MAKDKPPTPAQMQLVLTTAQLFQAEFVARRQVLEKAIKAVAQQMGGTITPTDLVAWASKLQQENPALTAEMACEDAIKAVEAGDVDADALLENRLDMAGVDEEEREAARVAATLQRKGFVLPGQTDQ